jgi:hypothetical protein
MLTMDESNVAINTPLATTPNTAHLLGRLAPCRSGLGAGGLGCSVTVYMYGVLPV